MRQANKYYYVRSHDALLDHVDEARPEQPRLEPGRDVYVPAEAPRAILHVIHPTLVGRVVAAQLVLRRLVHPYGLQRELLRVVRAINFSARSEPAIHNPTPLKGWMDRCGVGALPGTPPTRPGAGDQTRA